MPIQLTHLSHRVHRAAMKTIRFVFYGGVYVGKNTAQPANVQAKRVRCSGLKSCSLLQKNPIWGFLQTQSA